MFNFNLSSFVNELIYTLPAIVVALSVHEFAHAFIAYKLGDMSQKESGRLSLNPLRHLDPLGTLSLLVFRFGWAKPVQVDPYFFRNKKDGMIWTSVAGPIMNFIVGFLMVLCYGLMARYAGISVMTNSIMNYLFQFFLICAIMNVGLGIFNLIPIPPLDGSKVLMGILPEELYFKLMRYEQVLSLLLIFLLFTGVLSGPLMGARNAIIDVYTNIVAALLGMS